jgi:phenylacetic acid degradation operon negative regulatory protein
MDEAAARIYRTARAEWDGTFDLVVMESTAQRADRSKVAANLAFLGYGSIDDTTWVAVRAADEVDSVLDEAGLRYERFTASHTGGSDGAIAMVRRAWNLDEIGAAYERFVRELRPVVMGVTEDSTDEESYATRFRLVHAWRTFLFRDPQLPESLLPRRWPGAAAAAFFDRHAGRLRPAADRYVEACLEQSSRSLAARHLSRTPVKGVR